MLCWRINVLGQWHEILRWYDVVPCFRHTCTSLHLSTHPTRITPRVTENSVDIWAVWVIPWVSHKNLEAEVKLWMGQHATIDIPRMASSFAVRTINRPHLCIHYIHKTAAKRWCRHSWNIWVETSPVHRIRRCVLLYPWRGAGLHACPRNHHKVNILLGWNR